MCGLIVLSPIHTLTSIRDTHSRLLKQLYDMTHFNPLFGKKHTSLWAYVPECKLNQLSTPVLNWTEGGVGRVSECNNALFFPRTFSFWYGKVSQCFIMKSLVCMPDDFGLGHIKHYAAINNEK